jgi:ribosomal protein S18 acetylase RimI-like enzyme
MVQGDSSGGSDTECIMSLQITEAQATDIPDLARLNGIVQDLHAKLHPEIFRADWNLSDLEDFWSARLRERSNIVAVARLGGKAVGYIWFELQDRPQDALHSARRRIYVHHIIVDEAARTAGIGAKLLARAEAEAERQGVDSVVLDSWAANSTAHAFFAACGYDPINIVLCKAVG